VSESAKDITAIQDGQRQEVRPDMSRAEYFEACGLNPSSICKGLIGRGNELVTVPLYAKYAYETKSEPSDAMIKGTLAHLMCFEPERARSEVAIWTGGTRRGAKWNEFNEENAGRLIVPEKFWADCESMLERLLQDREFLRLVEEGQAEVAVFASESGLQCRGELDWISTSGAGALCDLKTARDIGQSAFGRAFFELQYDVKMGCYRHWLQVNGYTVPTTYVFAVRNSAPWDATVIPIPDDVLDGGWQKAKRCIDHVARCLESGTWDGINGREPFGELWVPSWEMADELVGFDS
jgi:hypothetical protein